MRQNICRIILTGACAVIAVFCVSSGVWAGNDGAKRKATPQHQIGAVLGSKATVRIPRKPKSSGDSIYRLHGANTVGHVHSAKN